ncbi:MAG: hypothetical protein WA418_18400 [Bradyrhizobium sp.]
MRTETALTLEKYQTELRRERAREEREKALRKQKQRRVTVISDVLNRASQAFSAMHVEALNRSGMELRALRRGDAAVAAFAVQMALPIGGRRGHDQLALPSLSLRPSGR